jgi:hypothetical protein
MREMTSKLIAMMDEGLISAEAVAEMALAYMSEDDVADMMRANDILLDEEENEVWQAYDGSCPDCGEDIPTDVVEGQECANCGHSFHAVREDDDGQPDEAQEWESFDADC